MRWPIYFLFAYLMLGLQLGVSRYVSIGGAAPNLALIAVVFIALNVRGTAASLACFAIGLTQDLLTQQRPGLYALSYGLLAIFIRAVHALVSRNHAITHIVLTLIGGLLTMFILLLHGWIHPAGSAIIEGKNVFRPTRIPAGVELMRVIYTTAVSPFILYALVRIRGVFAFQGGRRSPGRR